jgi:hypothetical protein
MRSLKMRAHSDYPSAPRAGDRCTRVAFRKRLFLLRRNYPDAHCATLPESKKKASLASVKHPLHAMESCLLQLERLDIIILNTPGDGGLWCYRAVADRVNSISERNQAAVVTD